MITTAAPPDPDLLRFNAATATIAATFELQANIEELRTATRHGDGKLARDLHRALQAKILRTEQLVDIAFPREGR